MKNTQRILVAFVLGVFLISGSGCSLLFYNQKIQFHGGDPEADYTVDGNAVDSLEKFNQIRN